MKRTPSIILTAALAVPLLALAAAPPDAEANSRKSPAKSLDLGLLRQANKVVVFLAGKEHTTVGVLPFKVQKGKREASYDAAPLAASLPGRLENALVMSMEPDEKKALKVLRDPAGHAAGQKLGAWTKDRKAFDRLFDTAFPVAWGDQKAKPSVFLTGTIKNTGDRALTTVEIVGFTKDDWSKDGIKTFEITTFQVKTDRALLRDLGYSYVLSPDVVKRSVSAEERTKSAVDKVSEEDEGKEESVIKPIDVAGIRFDIYHGTEKQSIRPMAGKGNSVFVVDEIPADTKIRFGLTRVTGEGKRLGVIVKVNGLSIYKMDDRDSLQCLKWLFDPEDKGTTYKFAGFQMDADGKEVLPFKVLSREESAARESGMGSRAGWIDIDVFASGEEEQEDEQLLVSSRGLSLKGKRPATLAELRKSLLRANNVSMKKAKGINTRGLIVYDVDPMHGPKLKEEDSLKNPVRIGGISIQYYTRSKQD